MTASAYKKRSLHDNVLNGLRKIRQANILERQQSETSVCVSGKNDPRQTLRYFRLMAQGRECASTLEGIKDLVIGVEENDESAQHRDSLAPVIYSPNLYSVSADFSLRRSNAYEKGYVLGIDAASAVCVQALEINQGETVLDLCCAPGTKLAMIAELTGPTGFVLGVDVSANRLDVARATVKKFGLCNVGLLLADGTHNLLSSKNVSEGSLDVTRDVIARIGGKWNKWIMPHDFQRKQRARRRRKLLPSDDATINGLLGRLQIVPNEPPVLLFDKVLVDAECTHDGSERHVQKLQLLSSGMNKLDELLSSPDRIANLKTLQRALLYSGVQHLKPGGTLVYSTCSMRSEQNEEVIRDVLQWPLSCDVVVKKLPFVTTAAVSTIYNEHSIPAVPVCILENSPVAACRFEPRTSKTSGLFLCCLQRTLDENNGVKNSI